jgi:DNA-binding HxlR family transcriptional regulator
VDVSRGTLSTRVKEAEDLGLVEKGIRKKNGHPAYILTEEGEEVKKESEKKAK